MRPRPGLLEQVLDGEAQLGQRLLAVAYRTSEPDRSTLDMAVVEAADAPRRGGHHRPAADEAIPGNRRMPVGGHPREDDHRRPRGDGQGYRPGTSIGDVSTPSRAATSTKWVTTSFGGRGDGHLRSLTPNTSCALFGRSRRTATWWR